MSSRARDGILQNFLSLTGCPSKAAIEYLEAANWDTALAMDLFYDSGGPQAQAGPSTPARRQQTRPPGSYPELCHRYLSCWQLFFFAAEEKFPTEATGDGYDSDDDLLQSALEENLRINASQRPAGAVANRAQEARPTAAAPKIGTVGALKKDEQPSENRGKGKTLPMTEREEDNLSY